MQIITDFGLSPSFQVQDGIDQGDALSPLLWWIFYDPLLVAIQSTPGLGYTSNLTWPHNVYNQDTWESFSTNVAVLAYMDDTIFAGASQSQTQRTIDLANSFYEMHDIDINGTKSELLVFNPSLPIEHQLIKMGREQTVIRPSEKEIRYLGVWFSSGNTRSFLKKRLERIIFEFLTVIKSKPVGPGHVTYLINRVLIPRLIYVAQLSTLTHNEWSTLFFPVLKYAKHALGVSSSFPTSALQHEGMLGIQNPWNELCVSQISALLALLNDSRIIGNLVAMRLRSAQLQAKLTSSIFRSSRTELCSLPSSQRNHNWALNSLVLASCMQVDFAQDQRDVLSWNITGGIIPIRQALVAQHFEHLISSIPISTHFPLFFVDQLLWSAHSIISWTHYRHVAHLKCQGKQANWFTSIRNYVRSTPSLFDSSSQLHPLASFNNFWPLLTNVTPNGTRKPLVLFQDTSGAICIGKITQNARRITPSHDSSSRALTAHIQRCSYFVPASSCPTLPSPITEDLAVITLIPNSFVVLPISTIKLFPFNSLSQHHYTCQRSWVDWIRFLNSPSLQSPIASQPDISSVLQPLPTIFLPGDTECIWIEK